MGVLVWIDVAYTASPNLPRRGVWGLVVQSRLQARHRGLGSESGGLGVACPLLHSMAGWASLVAQAADELSKSCRSSGLSCMACQCTRKVGTVWVRPLHNIIFYV